jgi:dipeptidyl aminopeptidase/acylaminoacyl peptidase
MAMRTRLALAFLLLCLSPALRADDKRTHDITLDDYFTLDILGQQQIAPDAKHVAYTVSRWDKAADGRKVDLWVVSCETKKSRRLTFDHGGIGGLHWMPDGKTVCFLARHKREGEKQPPHDGTAQVWRVGLDGKELQAVTRIAGGIEAFDLAPAGESLYYQVTTDDVQGDFAALKKQHKGIDYGHGVVKLSQLWRLDLNTWKSEKVVDEGRNIREFKVSPKGDRIAMITTPDATVVSFEGKSRVDVFDLKTKKTETVSDRCYRDHASSPYGWLEHLAWAPEGDALAFNVIFDAYPAEIIVARRDSGKWSSSQMLRKQSSSPDNRFEEHVRGYGSPLAWAGNNNLVYLMELKARVRLHLAREVRGVVTEFETLTSGEVVVESLSAAADGKSFAVVMNGTTHTPDLYLVARGAEPRRLTNLNPQVDTWKLPQITPISWKSRDDRMVEGILELPPDYKEGRKLPLVVCIHGWPTTADRLHLQYWIYGRTLLPAKGYAVLCPNYRGSTGYGDEFLTQLVGHENQRDVADILSGVDHLVERGVADPEKLGVMGWSNGGYLTNCVITHTTRFRAASSGAGIVDTVMEWGSNDEPAYAIAFKKGFPWDKAHIYTRTSPTYALDKIRTPTLIHVGGNDERCPPSHSRMLHRALKEYVKVPTELLVYPGEPHGLGKYSNRKAKMEWDLAWFDRYILGKK